MAFAEVRNGEFRVRVVDHCETRLLRGDGMTMARTEPNAKRIDKADRGGLAMACLRGPGELVASAEPPRRGQVSLP
jgi:hypothetical protein